MIGHGHSPRSALLSAVMLLIAAEPAFAHRLELILRVQAEQIEAEAFYSDNTPARQARIQWLSPDGSLLGEGLADEAGRFTFPRPRPGKYKVVVDAGAGHRVTKELWIEDDTATSPSEGVSREELTGVPWLKMVIGIGVIVGFFAAAWLARRRARPAHR